MQLDLTVALERLSLKYAD